MPLFHPRVIEKRLANSGEVLDAHFNILSAWAKNLESGIYDSETQNDGEFIQRILVEVLGYVGSSVGQTWTVAKNEPVGSGNVDVALGKFSSNSPSEIIAPFELKGAKTKFLDAVMSGRNKTPVQQAWEYAMDAKGAKWVLVSNYREIRLYAIGYGRKDFEVFDLSTMTKAANYHRFILLLSADNLLTGKTFDLLEESDVAEKEITKQLYTEYKAARSQLIDEIIKTTDKIDPLRAVELAQTILDRILFVAFAEDKGLLKKGTLKEAYETKNLYNPHPTWENFKGLFNAIDHGNPRLNVPGYNGGLFTNSPEISALNISDEACKRFADLGEYDYESDVSVNILGHIFEQSIADIEEIKKGFGSAGEAEEVVGSKRRTDGIFYTPPFITRHIIEQTVGKWLADRKNELGFENVDPLTEEDYASIKLIERGKKKGQVVFNANIQKHISLWEAYRDRLTTIKVVDPACGSGAFLNEVFDFLYREGQTINRTLETFYGGQINLFRWDTHILANNIFGVDINKESIEITKLSLWLKTANRNEKLSYLDDNIKTGNSLIKDSGIAGELAFDWDLKFEKVKKSGGFDIVVGNPPYVDSEAMAKSWARERDYITSTFNQTRGNWDLYIAFLELGCNLLSSTGYLSFITPDKWISKDFGIEIRKRISPGILSILPVGRDVFESALVDSIITTISSQPVEKLQVLSVMEKEVTIIAEINKSEFSGEEGFDQLLSPNFGLLRKFESLGTKRLKDIAQTENACATSDTYVLAEILFDAVSIHGYDPAKQYKVANTGTLSRYAFRWGTRRMRYLMNDYVFPVVLKSKFKAKLGATYQRRAESPKLIIKGLTLLDAAVDLSGTFIPGKSTLVICNGNPKTLKLLAGIVNSKFASFYIKQKYASASYNGGVNFTPDMLDSIPIPENIDETILVGNVDKIIKAQAALLTATASVHATIRASATTSNLRKKLDHWYALSNAEFISELSHQGLTLSVQEKAEWAEILELNKAKVAGSIVELESSNSAIDKILFDAFGLDRNESDLVRAS